MKLQHKIIIGTVLAASISGAILTLTNTESTSVVIEHYPIKNQLGVNVHQWDVWYYDFAPYTGSYDAKYKALIDLHPSSIRIYIDADGVQDINGNYAFNPSYKGGFKPEDGLKRIKASNPEIFIQACYQRQTPLIHKDWDAAGAWYSQLNFPYSLNNILDRLKPSTYASMGHDLSVMTIRGGRNKNAFDYPVYVNVNEPWTSNISVKGENFYDGIEGGNEWNGWWGNFNTNMNSQELAAAWKTMYDSVKKIDTSMLFTNGGIAYDKPDTFLKAIAWWKSNGYGIPVDYWSYHSYPSAYGQYNFSAAGGMNPEEVMYPRAKAMVETMQPYGKRTVIGEWGYDTYYKSIQNAPAFSTYNPEQTRAWWASRSVLKFDQAGIWRSQWYRAYEDYPNEQSDTNETQFSQMALLRQYNNGATIIKRTLVGDCFKQINDQFGDFIFDSAIRDDSVQVLKFKNGTKTMLVGWAVETYKWVNGRAVFTERKINYNFQFSGTRYDLNEDSSGVMKSQPFTAGNVQLNTKPFFILVDDNAPVPTPTPAPIKDSLVIFKQSYWTISGRRFYYTAYIRYRGGKVFDSVWSNKK
jgi:hypothetical protein